MKVAFGFGVLLVLRALLTSVADLGLCCSHPSGGMEFPLCSLKLVGRRSILPGVTADTFKQEIADALKAYDRYVVCIDKVPEDAEASLRSLMEKAIKAYENRGPHLRHGIALDRQLTIILSQTESDRPLCGIYFNLHSPYQKKASSKTAKSTS